MQDAKELHQKQQEDNEKIITQQIQIITQMRHQLNDLDQKLNR